MPQVTVQIFVPGESGYYWVMRPSGSTPFPAKWNGRSFWDVAANMYRDDLIVLSERLIPPEIGPGITRVLDSI